VLGSLNLISFAYLFDSPLMKYKILSNEELQQLEPELIQFLVVNGVDGSLWEEINRENPERALELVELFSDLVWQKNLEKFSYGEVLSNKRFMVFSFEEEKVRLFGVYAPLIPDEQENIESFFAYLVQNPKNIEVFADQKPYNHSREQDLFEWVEAGLLVSSQARFELIQQLYQDA